jgi:hypothetical protein
VKKIKNKSRIAGKPEDYEWSKQDQLFKHKTNGRFLSHKQARGIGLKIPATQPEQIAPLATAPAPEEKPSAPERTQENKGVNILTATKNKTPEVEAKTETLPDTEIFNDLPPEPEKTASEETKTDPQNQNEASENESPEAEEATAEQHRGLASAIWDGSIGVLSGLIGKFWQPRRVGSDPQKNEIPYDERELVITAFCEYFKSIGMAVMSPAQNLWLAIFTYASPRFHETFMAIKLKFFTKRAQPTPQTQPGDSRMPGADKTPPAQPQPQTQPANAAADEQAIMLGR